MAINFAGLSIEFGTLNVVDVGYKMYTMLHIGNGEINRSESLSRTLHIHIHTQMNACMYDERNIPNGPQSLIFFSCFFEEIDNRN